MFANKPVIGIAGGIGSGKTYIAAEFAKLGCLVVDSDQQVKEVYAEAGVKQMLKHWWGDEVISPDGTINRSFIAAKVFNSPAERHRLEAYIHPLVNAARRKVMNAAADNRKIVAYVWDTPLLFEASLNLQCDAVVFVEAPLELRLQRVKARNWDESELSRRENSQWPLDKKRLMSDYVISNTADEGRSSKAIPRQVKDVLSRIMSKASLRG